MMKTFSATAVLRRWRPQLEAAGYILEGPDATRTSSVLQASVGAVKSRGTTNHFHVNFDILVRDKYLSGQHYQVCFRGFIADGAVATYGNYRDFSLDEIEEAGRQVSELALPWLERHLRPSSVITMLNEAVSKGCRIEDISRPTSVDSPAQAEVLRWLRSEGQIPGAPFVYSKFLALLLEEAGDPQGACQALQRWYLQVKGLQDEEPSRTLLQLKSLGCERSEANTLRPM